MLPGRTAHIWGGDDVIIRAKHSVDVSASEHDVRIKAEKNMELLAGNGEEGGILIESRGTGSVNYDNVQGEDVQSAGILLRCPKGPVFTMASEIYLRTGSDDVKEGRIVIDASKGKQEIMLNAKSLLQYVKEDCIWAFGSDSANPDALNIFNKSVGLIDSQLSIAGRVSITNDAGLLVEGDIVQKGNGIANLKGGLIAKIDDIGRLEATINQINQAIEDAKTRAGQAYEDLFDEGLYQDPAGLGSAELQAQATFGFRTQEQYNSSSFKLPEPRWAQIQRLAGSESEKWEEKKVDKGSVETFPFPGKEGFEDQEAYLQLKEAKLFNVNQGYSKDRGSDYEDFEYPGFEKKSLNEYPTIL
jgi:hypothetical protein